MSARLKWYVATVVAAGLLVLAWTVPRIDLHRARQIPGTILLFGLFVLAGELFAVPIRRRGQVKELLVSSTFAFALVPLAGTAVAVLVLATSSLVTDLVRRKPLIKLAFNASQSVVSLAAGAAVYRAFGGGPTVETATIPAMAAGAALYVFLNILLVSTVLGLAGGTSLTSELVRDLPLELGREAMLVALAPVAVVVAERSLLLIPALVLPLGAVWLASKGQVEAEAAAERQRRLTEQEQELVRRLQEADRMKADLIATVSHELRSPLTTILGVFGLLRAPSRRVGPGEHDDLVLMGIRQSERLRRMIDQLLVAARFEEEGRGGPSWRYRTELDATELIRQAGAEAQARHRGRPIAIETNGSLPVRVARDAVVQVLSNLIDNACKYSPDGEPVRLYGLRSGATAVLVVEDAGPGIPSADRQRIFERFTQLDLESSRRAGGVGLGLYIARQLARSQDGELVVGDAASTGGARFELRLPIREPTGA
jgi:signal transduction histidine kinase